MRQELQVRCEGHSLEMVAGGMTPSDFAVVALLQCAQV